jgi:hypothetical protein
MRDMRPSAMDSDTSMRDPFARERLARSRAAAAAASKQQQQQQQQQQAVSHGMTPTRHMKSLLHIAHLALAAPQA